MIVSSPAFATDYLLFYWLFPKIQESVRRSLFFSLDFSPTSLGYSFPPAVADNFIDVVCNPLGSPQRREFSLTYSPAMVKFNPSIQPDQNFDMKFNFKPRIFNQVFFKLLPAFCQIKNSSLVVGVDFQDFLKKKISLCLSLFVKHKNRFFK